MDFLFECHIRWTLKKGSLTCFCKSTVNFSFSLHLWSVLCGIKIENHSDYLNLDTILINIYEYKEIDFNNF